MIAQFFLPPKKEKLPIPTGKLTDSPIRTDSTLQELHGNFTYNIIKQSKKMDNKQKEQMKKGLVFGGLGTTVCPLDVVYLRPFGQG